MSRRRRILMTAALLASLALPGAARAKSRGWPENLFREGRRIFYRAIKDGVGARPERSELSATELQKIQSLEKLAPRLYGLLVNYFYVREAPLLESLLETGTPEARLEFRRRYLDLVLFCGRTFVECLFRPSPNGPYFREIIPRFKDKDRVDIVLLATSNLANLELPRERKRVELSPEFERQWGLDAAKFRAAHRTSRGRGVRVAVLDSGIDVEHPVFERTLWGDHYNFVGRDSFPWDAAGPPMVDWGWHGTIVTSIIAKYAPEATLTVYRYIDADTQNDSPFPLIVTNLMGAAIFKAVHDGNDVINISAGTNLDAPYLREACQYAYDNNVIIVTASPYYLGRYLGEDENYPGQYPTTIAVTGIEKRGENKYGPWDIAAPEATTTVGSPNAPFVAFPTYVEEKDEYAPGISCATPIVASLVALVESLYPRLGTEPPGAYFETVRRLLVENADPEAIGFEGFSPDCGHGLIDAEKTVQAAAALRQSRTARAEPSASPEMPPPAASGDEVFETGRKIFYAEVGLALGRHPLRDRLLPLHLERIRKAETELAPLYENLINITFLRQRREFLELIAKGRTADFSEKYGELCRKTARAFIESLFEDGPRAQDRLVAPPYAGRDRLTLVLSSAGVSSARLKIEGRAHTPVEKASPEKDWAFAITRFPGALRVTKGRGVRVAVIDSGFDFEAEALRGANINRRFDFAVAGRTGVPWRAEEVSLRDETGRGTALAAVLASCAPAAELRLYKIWSPPQAPYEFWPAMKLAQAIYRAIDEESDIIVIAAALASDFEFLQEACRSAYERNVLLIAPNGPPYGQDPGRRVYFPAHYGSTLAVAGALPGRQGKALPWDALAPSHFTQFAAPAVLRPGPAPDAAVAVAMPAGLAALVISRVPKTGKELSGQYVQRVLEILARSADPRPFGFQSYNPKTGYGLIDAQKTIEEGVPAYLKKMTQIEDNFKKRMAQRAEEEEKRRKK